MAFVVKVVYLITSISLKLVYCCCTNIYMWKPNFFLAYIDVSMIAWVQSFMVFLILCLRILVYSWNCLIRYFDNFMYKVLCSALSKVKNSTGIGGKWVSVGQWWYLSCEWHDFHLSKVQDYILLYCHVILVLMFWKILMKIWCIRE